MLYHLALGAPGDGTPNAWNWSRTNGATGWNRWATAPWAIRSRRCIPSCRVPEAIRVPALREAERMSAVPAFLRSLRRPLPAGQPGPERVHGLYAAARFRECHGGFPSNPEGFAALMDRIIEFECELMSLAARHGFHGIHFADDWGTQTGLMISPGLWRRLFKPRYARQFAFAHEPGPAHVVSLLRRVRCHHGRLPRDRRRTCSTSPSRTWWMWRRWGAGCGAGNVS